MVSGFSLSGSGTYGISSRYYSGCTFADNVIMDKKTGIRVITASGTRIDGNIITDLQAYGKCIYVADTTDSVISNNTCSGGGQRGIDIESGSRNIVVTGNFVSGNQYGLHLGTIESCCFDRNLVMDNDYAFYYVAMAAGGNAFYANSFVNNSILFAQTLEYAETWNSLVPVTYTYNGATYTGYIGNYWGAGFPIEDADGNGIGDTGVSLFTDNIDSCPLVLPAEAYFGEPYGDIPVPATVEISPSSVILPGETTQQFSGTVYDQNGNVMTGASFRWTSSDERVGPITGDGLFSAEYAGTTTITAQSYLVRGTAEAVVNKTVLETVWTDPCESTDGWTLFNAGLQDGVVYKGSYSIGTPAIAGDAYAERTVVFPDGAAQFRFWAYQDCATNGVGSYSWLKAFIDNETIETLPVGQFKTGWNTYAINITGYETGDHTFRIESHFEPGPLSGRAIGFYVDQLEVRIDPAAVTPDISSITVSPASATLTHGETQQFAATAYDGDNNTISGVSFTWTSSDTSVGTVDASGVFTAHKVGTTTISAAAGDAVGTATVTVAPPHGDQTSDSPLNVPGCNITDKGDGTREVIVNLTATNATVNGNAIRIDEDTFTLIIETEGAPTVGNGTANGTVAGISLNTTPVSTNFDSLGNVTASLMANLTGIPSGAALETTISANISAAAQSAFQIAATADGLNLDAVAYTMNIVKTNLTNGQDIADATIRMSVSPAWVAANGGYGAIRIIRFAEDGTMEVLNTVYLGFDGELDQFEAYSPNGLSIFGLSATSAPSVAPSGSGFSSSGSGGVSSSISTARCDGICAGETGVFVMERTAITEIDVRAGMNIPSMMLTAEKVAKPSNIGDAPNAVYQYVVVTSYLAPEDGMEMATLKFSVDKAWLDSLGADASGVKMYHYDEATDSWVLLSTVACGEDGTCYTFFADTPSFSLFAITAEKGTASTAPESPVDDSQPAAASENTPAADGQTPADTQSPVTTTGNTTAIVILVVVAIIAVCGAVYWRKTSGKK